MNQLLHRLQTFFPHPKNPLRNAGDWRPVEDRLGFQLPRDYRDFILLYGVEDLPNGVRVLNFLDTQECGEALSLANLLREVVEGVHQDQKSVAEAVGASPQEVPSPLPFPIYPDEAGLFPWGTAEDGWVFYWLRQGNPNEWGTVVTYGSVMNHFSFPKLQLVPFLVQLAECPFHPRFTPHLPNCQ
jgi:hypothetical protein